MASSGSIRTPIALNRDFVTGVGTASGGIFLATRVASPRHAAVEQVPRLDVWLLAQQNAAALDPDGQLAWRSAAGLELRFRRLRGFDRPHCGAPNQLPHGVDSASRVYSVIDISLTLCKIRGMSRRHDRIPTLPPKEALILQLLAGPNGMYGLELVAASKRRLKRGTVYVTLGRMEKKGYVTSRLEDAPPSAGGLPRRVYEATTFGRRVLAAWNHVAARLVPEFAR